MVSVFIGVSYLHSQRAVQEQGRRETHLRGHMQGADIQLLVGADESVWLCVPIFLQNYDYLGAYSFDVPPTKVEIRPNELGISFPFRGFIRQNVLKLT